MESQWNQSAVRADFLWCASLLEHVHRQSRQLGAYRARLGQKTRIYLAAREELKGILGKLRTKQTNKKKTLHLLEISLRTTSVLQDTTHLLTHRCAKPRVPPNVCSSVGHTVTMCMKCASLTLRQYSSCHNKFLWMTVAMKSCSGSAQSYCSYWCKKPLTWAPSPRRKKKTCNMVFASPGK